MKPVVLFLSITFIINGFYPMHNANAQFVKYKYKFILKEVNSKAVNTTSNYFADDKINIKFSFENTTSLNFTVTNNTNDVMKIIWDEASIVLNGNANKVTHSGVKYVDASNSHPPTVMPPKSSVSDLVVPVDNISFNSGYVGVYTSIDPEWEITDLFDKNGKDAGTTFSFYLPIFYQDKTLSYNFSFVDRSIIEDSRIIAYYNRRTNYIYLK